MRLGIEVKNEKSEYSRLLNATEDKLTTVNHGPILWHDNQTGEPRRKIRTLFRDIVML